jgi:hypothetical protein
VDPQQPQEHRPVGVGEAGADGGEQLGVDLGADARGQPVQAGVAGQLVAAADQLLQSDVDQVGGVVLGPGGLADGVLGQLADLRGLVQHAQPGADEALVVAQRALGLVGQGDVAGQLQPVADVLGDRGGDVVGAGEVAQPLEGLEQHHQAEQVGGGRASPRAQAVSSVVGVNASRSSRAEMRRLNRG